MKSYELEDWCHAMPGKHIIFRGTEYHITRVDIKPTLVKIHTGQKNPIIILNEDLDHTLEEIKVLPNPATEMNLPETKAPSHTEIREAQFKNSIVCSSSQELAEILKENIKKVRDNKDYIPQAQEINSNVKSIIELAKAEIEYMKVMSYMNK